MNRVAGKQADHWTSTWDLSDDVDLELPAQDDRSKELLTEKFSQLETVFFYGFIGTVSRTN